MKILINSSFFRLNRREKIYEIFLRAVSMDHTKDITYIATVKFLFFPGFSDQSLNSEVP